MRPPMMHQKINSIQVTYLIYLYFCRQFMLFCQNVLTFLGLFSGVATKHQTNGITKLNRGFFDRNHKDPVLYVAQKLRSKGNGIEILTMTFFTITFGIVVSL